MNCELIGGPLDGKDIGEINPKHIQWGAVEFVTTSASEAEPGTEIVLPAEIFHVWKWEGPGNRKFVYRGWRRRG